MLMQQYRIMLEHSNVFFLIINLLREYRNFEYLVQNYDHKMFEMSKLKFNIAKKKLRFCSNLEDYIYLYTVHIYIYVY